MADMRPGLYVARVYSHTDKRHLIALESRCFNPHIEIVGRSAEEVRAISFKTANAWADWLNKENPKHKHFIIEIPEELYG